MPSGEPSKYAPTTTKKLDEIQTAISEKGPIYFESLDLRRLGPELSRLRSPSFNLCDLRGVTLAGTRKQQLAWSRTTLGRCQVDGLVFERADLDHAVIEPFDPESGTLTFRGCNLQDARIQFGTGRPCVRFTRCKLHRAVLASGHPAPRLKFIWTTGLWGANGANVHDLRDQETARFHHCLDLPTWERLRSIGATRLMSVSWFAAIGLVVYANALRWYNEQVEALSTRISEAAGDLVSWVDRLKPLPATEEFGRLLLSIVSIALAATILHLWCPPVVLHQSRHQWSVLSDKDDLEYQGASYDRWKRRWIATIFYLFGIYAAGYLIYRVVNSVAFFLGWLPT